jgi:hypothetical protein
LGKALNFVWNQVFRELWIVSVSYPLGATPPEKLLVRAIGHLVAIG